MWPVQGLRKVCRSYEFDCDYDGGCGVNVIAIVVATVFASAYVIVIAIVITTRREAVDASRVFGRQHLWMRH